MSHHIPLLRGKKPPLANNGQPSADYPVDRNGLDPGWSETDFSRLVVVSEWDRPSDLFRGAAAALVISTSLGQLGVWVGNLLMGGAV